MKHVVIVGNGIAGITAARHIRKRSDYAITVISSETEYFYARTALMYIYMGHMTFAHTKPYEDKFWKKNRIDLVFDHADRVDTNNRTVALRSGRRLSFDYLIIASGSKSKFPGCPGQELKGVQGLYSYHDLQHMEANTRNINHAVIVGGGLIGVELAEMLHSRKIDVTFLVREAAIWNNVLPLPDAQLVTRHIASHGIDIRLEEELAEIKGDDNGQVRSIVTSSGAEIPCQFTGMAIGVTPNIDWLEHTDIAVRQGVQVNRYLETNIPGIYAIGDCVERTYSLPGRKAIEQVWYTARMMGEVVAQTICGERTPYEPGPWFNSAKFFDIEFQTYGEVSPQCTDDEQDFYWEDPSGRKAIHVVWNKVSRVFKGINAFGIRMRHECFDRWLREGRLIDEVMARLPDANFDPEFSRTHDNEIHAAYKGTSEKLAAKP